MLHHVTHEYQPPGRRATYDDLLKVPDHLVAEIVDGVLYTSPRPASPHALAASVLVSELLPPFQRARGGPGGWVILNEPELHFEDDVLVPDIAGWRRARMPEFLNIPYFTLPPDWVCEVLSPSTARLDRLKKLHIYAREGVSHAWYLDPLTRTLEVMSRHRDAWTLQAMHTDDARVRAMPFDAIEIELPALWSPYPADGSRS